MITRVERWPDHVEAGCGRWFPKWAIWLSSSLWLFVSPASAASFEVTGFVIEGHDPLGERRSQALLAPFVGKHDDISRLRDAAQALEVHLFKRGYVFHRVSLPPQTLKAGKVSLRVSRLLVGKVQPEGNQYFSNANLTRSLPQLEAGETPNNKALTRALAVANANSAKRTQLTFARGEVPGSMDAQIVVRDSDPKQLYLWANNTGSEASTESRLGVGFQHRNVFDRDHQLSLSASVSPEDTDKVQQYGANYRIPLYRATGFVDLLAAESTANTGTIAEVFEVSGGGTTLGVGYTQILNKFGELRQQVSASVTDKLFENDVRFEGEPIGQDVRSRPLSLAYQAEWTESGWSGMVRISHDENLSGGSLNDAQSYEASRKGAAPEWQKQNLAARVSFENKKRWRTDFSLSAQETADKLVAGEKFGMGGSAGLRGFGEREAVFDKGISGSLALWAPPFKQMQLGAFYDWGRGETLAPETGEVASDTLKSAGLALKWSWRSRWVLDLSYGRVLDGIALGEDDEELGEKGEAAEGSSQEGDERVHVNLLYRIL